MIFHLFTKTTAINSRPLSQQTSMHPCFRILPTRLLSKSSTLMKPSMSPYCLAHEAQNTSFQGQLIFAILSFTTCKHTRIHTHRFSLSFDCFFGLCTMPKYPIVGLVHFVLYTNSFICIFACQQAPFFCVLTNEDSVLFGHKNIYALFKKYVLPSNCL